MGVGGDGRGWEGMGALAHSYSHVPRVNHNNKREQAESPVAADSSKATAWNASASLGEMPYLLHQGGMGTNA